MLKCFAPAFVTGITLAFLTSTLDAQTVLTTERVASGLSSPLYVASPPGDLDRIFIVEQRGTIRIVERGELLAGFFLDIRGPVLSGGERGLLGLAFDPNYDQNGYFYVNYTADNPQGDTIISRFTVSANPNDADETSELVLLGPIAQPFSNHNGGCLQIGPDGYLYIATGDGGSANDPSCNAQKGDSLLGKMLRIGLDGSIPPSNPYLGDPSFADEIWSYGLRNPWRFSFDRDNGDMYIGDVGQNAREEVDWASSASTGMENYGWKIMEGFRCNSSTNCPVGTPPCNDPSFTDPIHEYTQSGNGCSVTGGYVYRGCQIPDLDGAYFYADYCSSRVWSFRWDGSTKTEFQERTAELDPPSFAISSPASFGEDADGELYICDLGGEVFKIVALDPPPAGENLGGELAGTGGVEPILEACGLLDSGHSANFRLRKALPNSSAFLFVAFSSLPIGFKGGTLLAFPPALILFFQTDSEGGVAFDIVGGGGPIDVYTQYLIDDPGAVEGYSFSNAVKLQFRM